MTPPGTKTTPSEPEKLDGQSQDITAQRLAAIKAVLPEAFDLDGNLVQDKLIEALKPASYEASDDIPAFGLGWPGKQRAFAAAGVPTTATLRPCPDQSIDFDTTQNLLIEGDNLEVLKTLQRGYHGKVKMIYIDPPYNTGKDFVYPDNYGEGLDTYLQRTQQKDEDGFWASTNNETSGRKHANWLSMMAPRLILARNLLRDDGVIFVSIDDNEASNLKLLMDEVFGSENHLVTHYVQVRYASKTLAEKNDYQKLMEQVLVYAKHSHSPIKKSEEYSIDKFCWHIDELEPGQKIILGGRDVEVFTEDSYKITKVEPSMNALKETWATGSVLIANASGKFFGTHLAPRKKIDGLGVLYKVHGIGEDGLGYRYFTGPKKETATKGKFYSGVPTKRVEELQAGTSLKFRPIPNYYDFAANFGNCRHEGETDFRSGKKPIAFLSELINQAVEADEHALILDFFGGSASTAHAVMDLNSGDNGNRRYISVQLPEPLDEPVETQGDSLCSTIFQLGRERIIRTAKNIEDEGRLKAQNLDIGFRIFKLDSSNFTAWNSDPTTNEADLLSRLDQLADHTVPGRSETDILWEMLLKMGLPLDLKLERFELQGATFIGVGDRTKVISTQTAIPTAALEALLDLDVPPSELVVLDCAFEDDTARANIATLYKQRQDDDGQPLCNLKVV